VTNDRVVVNASPLIILSKSQLVGLLPKLFTEVLIPGAVWDEVTAGTASDAASRQLSAVVWARRVKVAAIDTSVAEWNLGAGESEVLSLAMSEPGCRAMIDDRLARACARTLSLPFLGTGGALVIAKQRGLIPSVTDALRSIRGAGIWLSAEVEQLLKQQAGE
jgi:predicted nucleic acid-binding protein